jgi:hypothetical protein
MDPVTCRGEADAVDATAVDPIMRRSVGRGGRVPLRDHSAAARPPNGEHARRRGDPRWHRLTRRPPSLSLR